MHASTPAARAPIAAVRVRVPDAPPGIAAPPKTDAPRWYCVRTGYNVEIIADTAIRVAGFTVFSPSLFKAATSARRDVNGVLRAAKPDRVVPLFPRYLFVQFRRGVDAWQRIQGELGVDYIFRASPGVPAVVPDQAIAVIRDLCAPNGCVYPPDKHATPLPVGAEARLLTGPMSEITGICDWSDGRRVRLLLAIMGLAVSVSVPRSAVESV